MIITELFGKRFINLTPHDIHVHHDDKIYTFERSGLQIRLNESHSSIDLGIPIPVAYKNFGEMKLISKDGEVDVSVLLNELTEGTFVIVSSFCVYSVLQLIGENENIKGVDVLVPDAGPTNAIRDEKGAIIGVNSFVLKRRIQVE